MLALHGIFLLVTKHGLEYPRFFERLYALLTPDVFTARHRVRFLTLADAFLSSGLVPSYTAPAFAKRFARLALTAPPAGVSVAIAFQAASTLHNLTPVSDGSESSAVPVDQTPKYVGCGLTVYPKDDRYKNITMHCEEDYCNAWAVIIKRDRYPKCLDCGTQRYGGLRTDCVFVNGVKVDFGNNEILSRNWYAGPARAHEACGLRPLY